MSEIYEFSSKPVARLREPTAEDGSAIWNLVRECKPLDENSMYCNLIQCDHFSDTCVVAVMGGRVVGWISAYILPNDPSTLFVWQVAVGEDARGKGLGAKMLEHIMDRDVCEGVDRIQTTITDSNKASWSLFTKFARKSDGVLSAKPHYTRSEHFRGECATENLISIRFKSASRDAA